MGKNDEEHGPFSVELGDEGDDERNIGLNYEQECLGCAPGAPRSAATEQGAHENAKIEPGDVDPITLVNILAPAQPRAAHAAAIQEVGTAKIDHLTKLAHRLSSAGGFQARPRSEEHTSELKSL